jgi:hypothetical protein
MDLTVSTIENETGKCAPAQPRWLRVPDACRVSGIGRSLLYQHLKAGSIRSVALRERNKVRGIRLVNAESLNAFIEGFEHNDSPKANAPPKMRTPGG